MDGSDGPSESPEGTIALAGTTEHTSEVKLNLL